jgi:hypothetical protein
MVNAEMQAYYQRQIEQTRNRQQNCSYIGNTSGGMTNGTMTCQ